MALASVYFGYQAIQITHSYWWGFAAAVIGGAALSAFIEFAFMRVLLKHTHSGPIAAVAPIIATLGLLQIVHALVAIKWGGEDRTITAPISNNGFTVGSETLIFSPMKLAIVITVIILLLIFSFIFQKTNLGLALRASAYSPEISRLAGIKVDALHTVGWALAGAAGGVAGMLQIANGNGSFSPESIEFSLLLVSGFIAAVIGGLESMVGAVAGGMLLGFVTAIVLMYLSPSLFFIAPFVILLIILIVRPQGLIGAKAGRRA
jgi:branched-chain amino acid transport system permease protein